LKIAKQSEQEPKLNPRNLKNKENPFSMARKYVEVFLKKDGKKNGTKEEPVSSSSNGKD
jgi:hypothetical protein